MTSLYPAGIIRTTGTVLLIFLCCSLFIAACAAQPGPADSDEQKVLVLHSYHPTFIWTRGQEEGILESLESTGQNISVTIEYLDWKNHPDSLNQEYLAKIYQNKYGSRPFDVILVTDDQALTFVVDHRQDVFGNAPVVFCGVNNYDDLPAEKKENVTGKIQEMSPEKTLHSVFRLFPAVKHVVVYYEDTETGQGIAHRIRSAATGFSGHAEFAYITNITFDEMVTNARALPADSVIISAITRDRNGVVMDHEDVARLLSTSSDQPVFAMYDMMVGEGAIGGSVVSGFEEGRIAGQMAARILDGAPLSAVPVDYHDTTVYLFDQQELSRFSVPQSSLPPGSVIINGQRGIIDDYFREVVAAAIVMLVLVTIIILLTVNIRRRKRAEERVQQQYRFLQKLMETIPNPLYFKDAAGRFLGCNRAFLELAGRDETAIVGRTSREIWPEDLAVTVETHDRELLAGSGVQEFESLVEDPDGNLRTILFTKAMFDNPDGSPEGIIGVMVDITERKKAQNGLQQATKKLSLLTRITHNDILNAIFSLSGYVALVKKAERDAKVLDYVRKEETVLKTMTEILQFANMFQDLGQNPPQWLKVRGVFLLALSHTDSDRILHRNDTGALEVYADPHLEYVFSALIAASCNTGTCTISLSYNKGPDSLLLIFATDGPGIPAGRKERIFEWHFEDGKVPGLYLAREILGITGMTIRECGDPESGVRFEITIPPGYYRFGLKS